jgi:hypothetical protein
MKKKERLWISNEEYLKKVNMLQGNPPKYISFQKAAPLIQPGWTHVNQIDFMIKRGFLEMVEDQMVIFRYPTGQSRTCHIPLGKNLYTIDLEIEEDFVQILIEDFYNMIEEYSHQEWLSLEQEALQEERTNKIEHLKALGLSIEKDFERGIRALVIQGLKL